MIFSKTFIRSIYKNLRKLPPFLRRLFVGFWLFFHYPRLKIRYRHLCWRFSVKKAIKKSFQSIVREKEKLFTVKHEEGDKVVDRAAYIVSSGKAWRKLIERISLIVAAILTLFLINFLLHKNGSIKLNEALNDKEQNSFVLSFLSEYLTPVTYLLICILVSSCVFVVWLRMAFWLSEWGVFSSRLFVTCLFVLPAICVVVCKFFIVGRLWKPQNLFCAASLDGIFFGAVNFCLLILFAIILSGLISYLQSRHMWRNPTSYLVCSLIQAIREVAWRRGKNVTGAMAVEFVGADPLIVNLEEIAACLEIISKRIDPLDVSSRIWKEGAYKRKAAAIRGLKKWVLLPKNDTWIRLDEELRRIYNLVISGDWDGLPESDLTLAASVPWWKRLWTLFRALLMAAIPLLMVFLFDRNKLLPDGEFKNYAFTIAGIWAVVNLLFILDPRFGEKLSALKGLPSIYPFGPKSEGK